MFNSCDSIFLISSNNERNTMTEVDLQDLSGNIQEDRAELCRRLRVEINKLSKTTGQSSVSYVIRLIEQLSK